MTQISGTTDSSYFQRTEGAFQIRGNHCDAAACEQDTISLRGSITFGKESDLSGFHHKAPGNRPSLLLGALWYDG